MRRARLQYILDLKEFLDEKSDQFNQPTFIDADPISIPHGYTRKQDIEITGLFAATLAWGQRITIIRKCRELFQLMDNDPYNFILNHSPGDLKNLENFKHRTFNSTDTLYFVAFLKWFYSRHDSLETAFVTDDGRVQSGLSQFHTLFFSLPDAPSRTKKHVATPDRKSTCKRLNMYLRWMVRADNRGVDFGLWKSIDMSALICPCDLHVDRVGRRLKLISRKQTDWLTAAELTHHLSLLDPKDPVKYDFALFGLGIEEGWSKLR